MHIHSCMLVILADSSNIFPNRIVIGRGGAAQRKEAVIIQSASLYTHAHARDLAHVRNKCTRAQRKQM